MNTPLKSSKPIPLTALVFIGWLFLMTFIPFLIILGMSFLERTPLGTISFHLSFNNYLRSFQYIYIKVLLKTVWLALVATLSCLAIGFPVAYYLARSRGWLKQLGLVLLFIPFWTNFILRVYGLVSLLGNHGLINQLLLEWGLIKTPLEILYTRTGVYLGLLYNYLPFLVVPIFSSLEKLDPALREAGFDLGANRIQVFWKVVVPNIKEGVFVGSLFVFIPMLGEYVIPDLLGGAKEAFLGNVMVSQFFVMQDWPFGSAIAGMLSLLLLITLWIQTRWSRIGGFRNGIDNAKS
ncbi:MAG: ABC transporter permease [Deltaproteobacteria bacterium]|nr:ABC transporter permease [Deltaproteobacteria bacterium]MBM4317484.1 ABC transporter permease [Deltaproteobacteria bacterium]